MIKRNVALMTLLTTINCKAGQILLGEKISIRRLEVYYLSKLPLYIKRQLFV